MNLADHEAVDVQRGAGNPEWLTSLRLTKSPCISDNWRTHLVTRWATTWAKLGSQRGHGIVLSALGMALYSGLSFGVPLSSGDDRLLGAELALAPNQVAKPILGAPSRFLWD